MDGTEQRIKDLVTRKMLAPVLAQCTKRAKKEEQAEKIAAQSQGISFNNRFRQGGLEEFEKASLGKRAGMLQEHWLGKWGKRKAIDTKRLPTEHIVTAIETYNEQQKELRDNSVGDVSKETIGKLIFSDEELVEIKQFFENTQSLTQLQPEAERSNSPLKILLPDYLAQTRWAFYERVGRITTSNQELSDSADQEKGVMIGVITFDSITKNHLSATLVKTNRDGVEINYIGHATTDKRCVYLDLRQTDVDVRVNVVLSLYESPQAQTIFVGHFTFFSTRTYNRLITKVVILDKIDSNKPSPEIREVKYTETAFEKLPDYLKLFLQERGSSVLRTPERIVGTQAILRDYLDHRKKINVNRVLEEKFRDSYTLFYKSSDEKTTPDSFEIKYSPYENALEVKYKHKPNPDKEFAWYGRPYLNQQDRSCLIIELSRTFPRQNESINDENPILIILHLPKETDNAWKTANAFPGIICGLQDTKQGEGGEGIAFTCLAVKGYTESTDKVKVEKFFLLTKDNLKLKLNQEAIRFKLDDFT